MRLVVHQALATDVYGDVARIYEGTRGDIAAGAICLLTATTQAGIKLGEHYVVVRGIEEAEENDSMRSWIRLDDIAREKLHVKTKEFYDFNLARVSWLRSFLWAWHSSNPGVRIAMQSSIVLFVLGLLVGYLFNP